MPLSAEPLTGTTMAEGKLISRFEMTRIVSARALQIAQGAPPLIEVPKGMIEPLEIAKLEWEQGVIPIEARKRISY